MVQGDEAIHMVEQPGGSLGIRLEQNSRRCWRAGAVLFFVDTDLGSKQERAICVADPAAFTENEK